MRKLPSRSPGLKSQEPYSGDYSCGDSEGKGGGYLRLESWYADNSVHCICHIYPSLTSSQFVFVVWSFQDLLDSDWASVRKVLEQADILVIKYSVTDKLAFQQVRNGYAPRLRPLLRHWGVPVILVAVGARLNGEDAFLCFAAFNSPVLKDCLKVAKSHRVGFFKTSPSSCGSVREITVRPCVLQCVLSAQGRMLMM